MFCLAFSICRADRYNLRKQFNLLTLEKYLNWSRLDESGHHRATVVDESFRPNQNKGFNS